MRKKKGQKQNNQNLGNLVMMVLTNTVLRQTILQHSYKIAFLINKCYIGFKHIPLKKIMGCKGELILLINKNLDKI